MPSVSRDIQYRLDSTLPRPLYLQLRDRIIAEIRRGAYRPGAAVPSISAFEASTNASRVTIVRALTRLVEDGFLFPQVGKGYYVAARGARALLAIVAPFDLRSIHYTGQLLAGAELAAGPLGYDVMELDAGRTPEEFFAAVHQALYERGARTLLVVPPLEAGAATAHFLAQVPAQRIAVVDRDIPGSLLALLQDRTAAYRLLANHLASVGVQRVATAGFTEQAATMHQALAEAGLHVRSDELSAKESLDDMARLCDALCCADDVIAASVFLRAKHDGKRLPVALTGFNHTVHGHAVPGGLTTIDPGLLEMGFRAVHLLHESGNAASQRILIAPRLIVGATTHR